MVQEVPRLEVISYSSLSDWQYCSHYFKLKHILKKLPDESTPYKYWGTLIHRHLQKALETGDGDFKTLIKTWIRFCRFYKLPDSGWVRSGAKAVVNIQKLVEAEFGEFEVLQVEERLALPTDNWSQTFKGFVDIVLYLKNGKIILIDFKTCRSNFMFNKFRDKFKDYQLTLYKYYYCLKYDIDPKLVETYFITIERPEKASKPVSFVRVTSGPKKVRNALGWLQTALNAINEGRWRKNRASCLKYGEKYPCPFYETPLCSK